MTKLYIGNLNPTVTKKTIEDEFYPFTVRIIRKSAKYALVEIDDRHDAIQAVQIMNGRQGWKVKLSNNSKGGGGGECDGGVDDRFECGEERRNSAADSTAVTHFLEIDDESSSKSYGEIKSDSGDQLEGGRLRKIRGNIAYEDENRRKIDVNKVPISKQDFFDEFAQMLVEKIEEKVRGSGAVYEENESLKCQLKEANLEISSAKAKEEELMSRLQRLGEELDLPNNRVSFAKDKGEGMSLKLENLRDELRKSIHDVISAKAKESEMSSKLKKVQEELENVKSHASSAKNKGEELSLKLKKLEKELGKSNENTVQLNAKLKEAEGARVTLQAEMKNINEKSVEWRKTADFAAEIFSLGVDINTEISKSQTPIPCYINRANAQKSLGRVRQALWYCRIAATLDSNFPEVQLTSANCHLVLGEVEDALNFYKKCLQSGNKSVKVEANDGLQKAQKVISFVKHSSELLQERTFSAATKALEVIGEALSISSFSEKLLERKGEALFELGRYEEVIQMCDETLDFAEKNFSTVAVVDGKNLLMMWRWGLMSKSYFRLGRLEIALSFIEKQENLRSTVDRTEESTSTFAATVRELLRCKNAGNEAFQSKRYTEAVKQYTSATLRSTESHPFSAVCLANRAASYKALGEIVDAIADCNLALALDGSYLKALFRRATLHEMIRDYEKAASDLKRFISLCEKQSPCQKTGSDGDVKRARRLLSDIEEKAERGLSLDLYLILGIKTSSSTKEIKTAYHKAARKHHPDKAGQFLARSDCGHDGLLWKETSETISKDADGLFKIIGKAYSVLSDSRMRSNYDYEEQMRNYEYDYAGNAGCTCDEEENYYYY